MPETLLRTKLYVPPQRPNLVSRPELIERLNQGLQLGHKLTLISASAGFGKTTMVSEWLAGGARPVAWLSLDEGDNDPTRFLTYFIAAVQTVATVFGEGVLAALQSPQPASFESILTTLLNEIATISKNVILVLDDYHVIDAQPVDASISVDAALTFLLEHLPPQLHMVIATREDPNLPLARYRVRGQLTELRVTDLRFTPAETAKFLNQIMDLKLSAEEVSSLETRTEGWIAGLQLAALSMRGREDVPGFIGAFAGDNRYVVDYLVEEVLQGQPEPVRTFLLQTSILDRLSGPLCAAVCSTMTEEPGRSVGSVGTGQEDRSGILEILERGDLFVIPLDDRRQWYRYHHLFADVLQARLLEEQSDRVAGLHRRASAWYELNRLPSAAIRHALAAEDFEHAADLIELAWPSMEESFQSATWLGWVKALPKELVRSRPVLCVDYAWALLNGGELEAAEARLRQAERALNTTVALDERPETQAAGRVVVDHAQFRSLSASIAAARAYSAQALGDVRGTLKYAWQVLDLLPAGDQRWRGPAMTLLGLAYWASGDLEAAHQSFADFMANMRNAGNIADEVGSTFVLADIMLALGRLRGAFSAYQQSLQLAASQGEPMPLGTADVYRGISELYLERSDIETAVQHLLIGKKLGEQVVLTDWQHRLCVTEALIKNAQGDLDGALRLLNEAERLTIRTPLPNVRPVAALKTRVWVRQRRLSKASAWVRDRRLSVEDDLSYLGEFEHITLARLLIAQYRADGIESTIQAAKGLLGRLLKAAEEGSRWEA